jgi:nucleoid DNA-binding protein
MEALLQKAIEINSTTILPNFGAFMKMGKSVLFNEFLKYDDGKLAKVVAETEGISEQDAKSKISDWIVSANAKLDKGETITITNIGSLIKENGKLKFTANAASEKTNEVPVKLEEQPKEEKKVTENPVVTLEEVKKETIKKEAVKKEVKPIAKVVNISTDFSAQDAIDKIKNYENKNDLITFTRGDKRKTVIDALNKRLDALNGKITVAKTEDAPVPPLVTPLANIEKPIIEKEKTTDAKDTPPLQEKQKAAEKVIEKTVTPVEIIKKEEPKAEKKTPIMDVKDKKDPLPEVKKVEEEKAKTVPPVKESPKKKSKTDEKAIAAIASSVEKTEQQLKKRKRRKLVLWLAIICLLIGGSVIGFLKKDVLMAYFDKKHEPKELADNTDKHKEESEAEEKDVKTEEEMIASDNIEVPEEQEPIKENIEVEPEQVEPEKAEEVKEVAVPKVTNSSTGGNYHIVAGSFSSKENANNKVESLKSKGYNSAKVLGKYGGLYTVRAMSFSSSSEAKAALKDFKADGNKGFVKKL